ncbi:MAG: thioesterase family protein [Pseudobdellovibrio sp.]
MFKYQRRVHVYETDLMGIVHHSNYLRLCEEARVEWCTQNALIDASDKAVFGLAVTETRVKHVSPARYADLLTVSTQVRTEGVRMFFQYKITSAERVVCLAETVHCSLDLNFKVKRLNADIIKSVEKEIWTETWL